MVSKFVRVALCLAIGLIGGGWERPAHAGMIGPPVAERPKGGFSAGLEGGMIRRELAFEIGAGPDIDMVEIQTRGTYGLFEGVNVFLTLGSVDDDIRILDYAGSRVVFLAKPNIVYGAGFKMTLLETGSFQLGGGGEYERFVLEGRGSVAVPLADAELTWQEARFFGGVRMKDVPYFVPYGGIYLSAVRGEMSFSNPAVPESEFEESEAFGIFYGGDFKVWKDLLISIELRLIAETSGAFSVKYPF